MVAGILMSIAEYERELVRERTALKLEHARKSGRKFGRPAKLTSDQAALAQRMKANGETAATICRTLGIGRTTLYRYLAESDAD
jgi:DNA invertase Pin-like site-specific DNA recombinase